MNHSPFHPFTLSSPPKLPNGASNNYLESGERRWELGGGRHNSASVILDKGIHRNLFRCFREEGRGNQIAIFLLRNKLTLPITCKIQDQTNYQYYTSRIFENGVDMDISKLYPPIEFPVSRGTPMISPLIKWDHREDFHVVRYESNAAMKSERSYTVNISDPEFDFITGHNIDGTVLINLMSYQQCKIF